MNKTEALVPCSNCCRTFARSRVSKHESICRKVQKRRPAFDSGKQRSQGTDIPLSVTRKTFRSQKARIPKTNWRARHREFISAIRNARKAVVAVRTGQPLPPPPPPADNPDYITCRSCYRRFNAQAAARHIPVCTNRRKEVGEPVSFAFRTVPADYGSKNYYAKQYAKTIQKPTVEPRILRRNVHGNAAQNSNTVYEDECDWPVPTDRSFASNSTIYPYNGCSSKRIYQDQPTVFTNTGLTPVVVSGNRYKRYPRPGYARSPPKKAVIQPHISRSHPKNAVLRRRCDNAQTSRSLPTPTASRKPTSVRINAGGRPTVSSSDSFIGTGRQIATPRLKLLTARENQSANGNIAYSFGNLNVYED